MVKPSPKLGHFLLVGALLLVLLPLIVLRADPACTTVDGYNPTSIAIVEDSTNGSLVTGSTAPGKSVVFVLQAPESQLEQVKATLVDVPKFD